MSKASAGKKPKKKRGRPKGSKNKPKVKEPKIEPEVKEPKKEPEVKAEPTLVAASEAALKASEAAAKATKVKPTTISEAVAASEGARKAAEAAAKAEAEARLALERSEAARSAAEAAAEEEYKAAAAEAVTEETIESFTNKRALDRIFKREMGEPEFWLDKNDRLPPRPILSKDEEEEISRKAEIPLDQTPSYHPEHILSPEYAGISNYELGIKTQREEIEQRLIRLRSDPTASAQEINQAEEDLKTLDYLFENFYSGMNVFRTAKGGRSKLRE